MMSADTSRAVTHGRDNAEWNAGAGGDRNMFATPGRCVPSWSDECRRGLRGHGQPPPAQQHRVQWSSTGRNASPDGGSPLIQTTALRSSSCSAGDACMCTGWKRRRYTPVCLTLSGARSETLHSRDPAFSEQVVHHPLEFECQCVVLGRTCKPSPYIFDIISFFREVQFGKKCL